MTFEQRVAAYNEKRDELPVEHISAEKMIELVSKPFKCEGLHIDAKTDKLVIYTVEGVYESTSSGCGFRPFVIWES